MKTKMKQGKTKKAESKYPRLMVNEQVGVALATGESSLGRHMIAAIIHSFDERDFPVGLHSNNWWKDGWDELPKGTTIKLTQ